MISNWVCSTTYTIIIPLCNLFAANCTKNKDFENQIEMHEKLRKPQLSLTVDLLVSFQLTVLVQSNGHREGSLFRVNNLYKI